MTKLISALAIMLIPSALFAQHSPQVPEPVSATSHLTASYGRIPLSFEANRGQTDPSVQFLAHGQEYTLFLREGEAVLALRRANPHEGSAIQADDFATSVVRVQLVGANRQATVRPEDLQITKTNYFIGNDPTQWQTRVPNYGRVRYADIYPGIDLVYYGNQRQLEHDFVVAPGRDPGRIAFVLKGAERLRIDPPSGDLIVSSGQSELRLLRPVTYQDANGQPTYVASSYKLLAGNKVGFLVGKYDHARPLVIDPVLVYSTYLGGSGNSTGAGDQGNGIAVDDRGHAYVVGTTYSIDFPVTRHARRGFQVRNHSALAGSGGTVFVTKLNAAGTALVYSTYLGGSGGEFGYGIALDSSDHAYVTGATTSTDFPVTCEAFQTENHSLTSGTTTAFVAKLDEDGDRLAYSTYLGGSGNQAGSPHGDVAQAIAVDARGHAYVTGYTWSPDFPVSAAAFQAQFAGSATVSNVFVTKLNRGGTRLLYSTYLGGSGTNDAGDYGNAIVIDPAGDAFVTGSTSSVNFPVTVGAYQPQNNSALAGHGSTAFVTELNPLGEDEVYSTYLGGSGGDSARAIAIDSVGSVYVSGITRSGDFPVTPGVLQGENFGFLLSNSSQQPGAFVTKLNQTGSALAYSTYLGGWGTSVSGLAVDSAGTAYVTGSAPTAGVGGFSSFQETPDALSLPASTGSAAFVVKLDPSAAVLNYATLLGGSSNDNALALALDTTGNAYLTGSAFSTDFPATSGAFQTMNNTKVVNGNNAFVSKLALATEANQTAYPGISSIPTHLTLSANFFDVFGNCSDGPLYYSVCYGVTLTTADGGTPNGLTEPEYLEFDGIVLQGGDFRTSYVLCFHLIPWQSPGPVELPLSASYSGDSKYAPSSASETFYGPSCPSAQALPGAQSSKLQTLEKPLPLPLVQGKGPSPSVLSSTAAKSSVLGQKFAPPQATAPGNKPVSEAMNSDRRERRSGCSAPRRERREDDHERDRKGMKDRDSD